jgi:hypothetical protein
MTFASVPTQPAATIWEGELLRRTDLEPDNPKGLLSRHLDPEELKGATPVVTIGRPEVLRALGPMETPGFEAILSKDLYLIRLWCSFHDRDGELRFDRAHFTIGLSSSSDPTASIVARDMHPSKVLHKVKRDVNVGLSPEATFAEVGVKIGSLSYGFAYTELQPAITAAGQGEAQPRWTFERTKSQRLQGGKAMHLLVAAPEGTSSGEAELDLLAYVTKPGRLAIPMGIFEKRGSVPAEKLKVTLW